jgi:hypothetical protein
VSATAYELERAPVWLREHRLENCEAFRVERDGEPVGFVEEVELDTDGAAASLVIASGGAPPCRVRVSVVDVADVDPARCLVTLAS